MTQASVPADGGAQRPLCACHNKPMRWNKNPARSRGGSWRCLVKYRAGQARSASRWRAKNPEKARDSNARMIKVWAGGIQFYVGHAPTLEAKDFMDEVLEQRRQEEKHARLLAG